MTNRNSRSTSRPITVVISEDAADVLTRLRERPGLKWEENPPWEIYEEDGKHYRAALTEIRISARKQLGV
jgi:hypothetical protein